MKIWPPIVLTQVFFVCYVFFTPCNTLWFPLECYILQIISHVYCLLLSLTYLSHNTTRSFKTLWFCSAKVGGIKKIWFKAKKLQILSFLLCLLSGATGEKHSSKVSGSFSILHNIIQGVCFWISRKDSF